MGALARGYLVIYNLGQAFAWSLVLFTLFKTHFLETEPSGVKALITKQRSDYHNTAWLVGIRFR